MQSICAPLPSAPRYLLRPCLQSPYLAALVAHDNDDDDGDDDDDDDHDDVSISLPCPV
jgi:hypothetical protein